MKLISENTEYEIIYALKFAGSALLLASIIAAIIITAIELIG